MDILDSPFQKPEKNLPAPANFLLASAMIFGLAAVVWSRGWFHTTGYIELTGIVLDYVQYSLILIAVLLILYFLSFQRVLPDSFWVKFIPIFIFGSSLITLIFWVRYSSPLLREFLSYPKHWMISVAMSAVWAGILAWIVLLFIFRKKN